MKIRPVGDELFHEGTHTDRQNGGHEETEGRFSQYCNRP